MTALAPSKRCGCSILKLNYCPDGTRENQLKGRPECMICRGTGAIRICPKCRGAGMLPGSHLCKPCSASGSISAPTPPPQKILTREKQGVAR